jgi:hypothetical protein
MKTKRMRKGEKTKIPLKKAKKDKIGGSYPLFFIEAATN